jgi:uncharacterized protein (DUF4415 family)
MTASKKRSVATSRKPFHGIGWYDEKGEWVDPDDAPDLTEEPWRSLIQSAPLMQGDKVIRPGRPPKDMAKVSTTIRLDADVLAHFRAGGPGWQSRINAALRAVMAGVDKVEPG